VVDVTGLAPDIAALLADTAADPAQMRERLAEIAARPGLGARLLEAFAVDNLPAAFTLAQSLDRARFRDVITPAKEGVEQTVVLRFRGRGALLGHVVDRGQTQYRILTYYKVSAASIVHVAYRVDGRHSRITAQGRRAAVSLDGRVGPCSMRSRTGRRARRRSAWIRTNSADNRARERDQANGMESPYAAVLLRHESAELAGGRRCFRDIPAPANPGGPLFAPGRECGSDGARVVGWVLRRTRRGSFFCSLTPMATAFGRVLWATIVGRAECTRFKRTRAGPERIGRHVPARGVAVATPTCSPG
jgi:hypothetical protein